jgi:hypothetical protein
MMMCSVKHPCLKRPEGLKDTRLSGKCLSRLTKLGDWPVGVSPSSGNPLGVFLIRGLLKILKRFLNRSNHPAINTMNGRIIRFIFTMNGPSHHEHLSSTVY